MTSVIPVQCSTCSAPVDYQLFCHHYYYHDRYHYLYYCLLPRATIYNSFRLSAFSRLLLLLLLSFLWLLLWLLKLLPSKEFSTIFNVCPYRWWNQSNNSEEYVLTIKEPRQFFLFSYVTIGTKYLKERLIPLKITSLVNSENSGLK